MIATSVKQSKKLLKLGLKPETADMWYNIDICDKFGIDSYCMWPSLELTSALDIPAWSLSTLLNLMPVSIIDDNYFFVIEKDRRNCDAVWRVSYTYIDFTEDIASFISENIINAAVEMVEWLLENKYIIK